MKLEKAIEILSQHQCGTDPLYLPELPEAEGLGIEALKKENRKRTTMSFTRDDLLPGETTEE